MSVFSYLGPIKIWEFWSFFGLDSLSITTPKLMNVVFLYLLLVLGVFGWAMGHIKRPLGEKALTLTIRRLASLKLSWGHRKCLTTSIWGELPGGPLSHL